MLFHFPLCTCMHIITICIVLLFSIFYFFVVVDSLIPIVHLAFILNWGNFAPQGILLTRILHSLLVYMYIYINYASSQYIFRYWVNMSYIWQ